MASASKRPSGGGTSPRAEGQFRLSDRRGPAEPQPPAMTASSRTSSPSARARPSVAAGNTAADDGIDAVNPHAKAHGRSALPATSARSGRSRATRPHPRLSTRFERTGHTTAPCPVGRPRAQPRRGAAPDDCRTGCCAAPAATPAGPRSPVPALRASGHTAIAGQHARSSAPATTPASPSCAASWATPKSQQLPQVLRL